MIIRDETASDRDAIRDVTIAAFRDHPFSRQTEQFVIQRLRDAGALTVSLVAEIERVVVGHIGFSPVEMTDGTPGWYGLGPLSVLPGRQRRGIGSALVSEGLARLKRIAARGCVLVGEPAYYQRFGFRSAVYLTCDGVPQDVFLVLPFTRPVPQGRVIFHEAFQATD